MKIGIFGGSFNPPHQKHKNIAIELIEKGYLDKVIYVPTGDKYNKKDLIDAKYRLKMLKLLIEDYNDLLVSDYELKNALTYTYQTLDYFQSKYPNDFIYFICGSDNLKELTTWKNYKYILDKYKLLVIRRNDDDITLIINNLDTENIILTDIMPQDVSSTKIRKQLFEKGEDDNLDVKVINYIKRKNLYR